MPWAHEFIFHGLAPEAPETHQSTNDWCSTAVRPEGFPSIRDSIIGVAAHDPSVAYLGARAIGHTVTTGVDIELELGQSTRPRTLDRGSPNEVLFVDCSNAFIRGSTIVAETLARLSEVGERRTRRVLIVEFTAPL